MKKIALSTKMFLLVLSLSNILQISSPGFSLPWNWNSAIYPFGLDIIGKTLYEIINSNMEENMWLIISFVKLQS